MADQPAADNLAANLRALMAALPRLSTQAKVAEAAQIDQSTVGRILNVKHSPRLEQIEAIARATGVQPWQLLAPLAGTAALPTANTWPLKHISQTAWDALSADDRAVVDWSAAQALRSLQEMRRPSGQAAIPANVVLIPERRQSGRQVENPWTSHRRRSADVKKEIK
jgi:transcriptional regulator with XRE-family HTH domain